MKNYRIAGFWLRAGAAYLNISFLLLLAFILVYLLASIPAINIHYLDYSFLRTFIFVFFLLSIVDVTVQGFWGFNFGKYLLGLRVIREDSKTKLRLLKIWIRTLASIFSFAFVCLGLIASLFNEERKTMHDFLAGSIVVEDLGKGSVSKFFAILVSSFAVLLTFALPFGISYSSYTFTRGFINSHSTPSFDAPMFKASPGSQLRIALSDSKLTAMAVLHEPQYLSFRVDKNSKHSFIDKDSLELLDINFFDLEYRLDRIENHYGELKLDAFVTIPHLILKDEKGRDINVHKLNFVIGAENIIGSDILDLFDFSFNSYTSSLNVRLHSEERKLVEEFKTITNPSAEQININTYKHQVFYSLRRRWHNALKHVEPDLLKELALKPQLANDALIEIDPKTGYIRGLVLTAPSKSELFNEFCKDFINSFGHFDPLHRNIEDKLISVQYVFRQ